MRRLFTLCTASHPRARIHIFIAPTCRAMLYHKRAHTYSPLILHSSRAETHSALISYTQYLEWD
jgi:hypothetical protein